MFKESIAAKSGETYYHSPPSPKCLGSGCHSSPGTGKTVSDISLWRISGRNSRWLRASEKAASKMSSWRHLDLGLLTTLSCHPAGDALKTAAGKKAYESPCSSDTSQSPGSRNQNLKHHAKITLKHCPTKLSCPSAADGSQNDCNSPNKPSVRISTECQRHDASPVPGTDLLQAL